MTAMFIQVHSFPVKSSPSSTMHLGSGCQCRSLLSLDSYQFRRNLGNATDTSWHKLTQTDTSWRKPFKKKKKLRPKSLGDNVCLGLFFLVLLPKAIAVTCHVTSEVNDVTPGLQIVSEGCSMSKFHQIRFPLDLQHDFGSDMFRFFISHDFPENPSSKYHQIPAASSWRARWRPDVRPVLCRGLRHSRRSPV